MCEPDFEQGSPFLTVVRGSLLLSLAGCVPAIAQQSTANSHAVQDKKAVARQIQNSVDGVSIISTEVLRIPGATLDAIVGFDPFEGLLLTWNERCFGIDRSSSPEQRGNLIDQELERCGSISRSQSPMIACVGPDLTAQLAKWRIWCRKQSDGFSEILASQQGSTASGEKVVARLDQDVRGMKIFMIHSNAANLSIIGKRANGEIVLTSYSLLPEYL